MFNLEEIRKQFPMLNNKTMQGNRLVFLDNASTTFKPECVINAMNKYYTDETSNSHRGDYDLCYNMDVEIDKTRELVAQFINAKKNETVFTSGDTESINTIAYGYGLSNLKKGDGILISESEHASNSLPWFRLKQLIGCEIYFVDLDKGLVTPANVEKAFKTHPNIKLVSFAHIGNVLGYEIDLKEITSIVHKRDAVMVVDGAQSVPHKKVDFKDLDIDFLAFSAHKMCGPTGIGALIVKEEIMKKMDCFLTGGGMNVTFSKDTTYEPLKGPSMFEAGTLNIAGIIGFGAAIKFLNSVGMDNIEKYEQELHQYLLDKLKNVEDIEIYNPLCKGSIFTFNKKGVFSQDEATLLNSKGIAVRSGQHCAKMIDDVIEEKATVRMSTYFYTSKEEIDIFVDALINGGDILDAYFK